MAYDVPEDAKIHRINLRLNTKNLERVKAQSKRFNRSQKTTFAHDALLVGLAVLEKNPDMLNVALQDAM